MRIAAARTLLCGILLLLCLAGCNEDSGKDKTASRVNATAAPAAPAEATAGPASRATAMPGTEIPGKAETPGGAEIPANATAEDDAGSWRPGSRWATFETDGKGGLYFEDFLREQEQYPGLADYIIQGGTEPDFVYIIHYPQELGGKLAANLAPEAVEKADAAVLRFVQQHAAGLILREGTPRETFFSETFAKPEAVAAYEQSREKQWQEEGVTLQEYLLYSDRRVFPIFITYAVTEAPGALSINFQLWLYGGGAHDNWTYAAISLDKATGEVISKEKLFNSQGSFERTEEWLSNTEDAGYYFYGSCMTDEVTLERTNIDLTPDFMRAEGLVMRRIIFTPQGLEVIFAPYEQGGFAMGDVHAPISLQEINALGINNSYWEEGGSSKK